MTGYTRQYKQFEKIIREQWLLLLKDRELTVKPQFIYTKPPTLQLKLAHNVINPQKRSITILDQTVFLAVGNV